MTARRPARAPRALLTLLLATLLLATHLFASAAHAGIPDRPIDQPEDPPSTVRPPLQIGDPDEPTGGLTQVFLYAHPAAGVFLLQPWALHALLLRVLHVSVRAPHAGGANHGR